MAKLTRPQVDSGAVYLWPCNVTAWNAFIDAQTQWRVGFNGRTGLDYQGVRVDLIEQGMGAKERRAIWPGIKACELAALGAWSEERERREAERQRGTPMQPGWS